MSLSPLSQIKHTEGHRRAKTVGGGSTTPSASPAIVSVLLTKCTGAARL